MLGRILLFVAFTGAFSSAATAQEAFGVKMGAPLSSLHVLKNVTSNIYQISVTTPNSEFESYDVLAVPGFGVCKITGIGKTHEGDSYGSDIRSAFDELNSALTEKYGHPKSYDFLNAGSIWNDPKDFAMALKQNERHLTSFWSISEGANVPAGETIMLDAKGLGSSDTYLTLGYEFPNFEACKAKLDAADNSGL